MRRLFAKLWNTSCYRLTPVPIPDKSHRSEEKRSKNRGRNRPDSINPDPNTSPTLINERHTAKSRIIKTGGLAHVYLSACWTDFWLLQRMPHSVGERML